MYQLTTSTSIKRLADSAFIPVDPANRDYAEYIVWVGGGNEPLPVAPTTDEQLREEWKAQRAAQVEAIKVTTQAGNTFDGDEIGQGRMARAIIALDASAPGATVNWVLADNSMIQATSSELVEALAMAGAAQAAIWVAE